MMERRDGLSNIDLDIVTSAILARHRYWHSLGLRPDALTWMENTSAWPVKLLTDRSQVRQPRSLGLRLHGEQVEAELVVYAGGWADLDYITSDHGELTSEYVELDQPVEFVTRLDRVVARMSMEQVAAECLVVGDLIELFTLPSPELIRLTSIKPRVHGIKFEGLNTDNTVYSFGFNAARSSPESSPEPLF